jgi:hypothetical protein
MVCAPGKMLKALAPSGTRSRCPWFAMHCRFAQANLDNVSSYEAESTVVAVDIRELRA